MKKVLFCCGVFLLLLLQTTRAQTLSPPTITYPGTGSAPGSTLATTTPTFQWNAVSGATKYGLYISKSPYGSPNIIYSNTSLTGTSFTIPSGNLQNGVQYRWNMTSFNSAGEGTPCTPLYFQISLSQPPSAPVLISPGSSSSPGPTISTLVPTMSWNAVGGATNYGLYVSDQTTGGNLVYNNDFVGNVTSLVLPSGTLTAGHSYRWNMRASNSAGFSGYSSHLYFQTQASAPTVTNVSPNPVTGSNAPQSLNVYGSGFQAIGMNVTLRDVTHSQTYPNRSYNFVNAGQISLNPTLGTDAATWSVQVANTIGQGSSPYSFSVNAPLPVITSLSPSSATAGGAGFTMTVNGSTFNSQSVVRWNGLNRITTPIMSSGLVTGLQTSISGSDIATAGTNQVTVYTPAPGGGTSIEATFIVSGNLPDLTVSANPASTYNSGQAGVHIYVTVNRSGGNLPSNSTYVLARLYLSTNSIWDAGDIQLWESDGSKPDFPVSYLNGNGSRTVDATVTIPNVAAGTYYIIAYVDPPTSTYPSGFFDESNENNNIIAYSTSIAGVNQTPHIYVIPTSLRITQQSGARPESFYNARPTHYDSTLRIPAISQKLISQIFTDKNGETVDEVEISGKPPEGYRAPVAKFAATATVLDNVPAYDWSFGCSATSAAMIAGYYDNHGYSNMYAGPTNNGFAPMDNSIWGSVVINGERRSQCPLSATRYGVDGRTIRGHVDDYWIKYGDCADQDPFIANGWQQHLYGNCTGDFMKTSQSSFGNCDGWTYFDINLNGSRHSGTNEKDGCYGLAEFFQSRGYSAVSYYSQFIYGYNNNTQGFTFSEFEDEINAGRPVLIQVANDTEGHTMVGFGYDATNNLIYIHDTWDYSDHSMTWGGTYSSLNLQQYGVCVFHLAPVTPQNVFTIQDIGNANLVISSITSNKKWLTTTGYSSTPFALIPSSGQQVMVDVNWTSLQGSQDVGTVTITSNDPTTPTVTVQVTAIKSTQTPTITVSTTSLSDFGNVQVGTSSLSQHYTVSGSNLAGNILITPPAGFQVSTDNNGFSSSMTLQQYGGSVPATTVYARFSPISTGLQSSTIKHTSQGAQEMDVSVSGTGTSASTHFTPIWTDNPYLAMNIYVSSASYNGVPLKQGDEIAVFDGTICVGTKALSEALSQSDPLTITASTDDPNTPLMDGFTPGDPVTYKLWIANSCSEVSSISSTYASGNGTFASQGTAVVNLVAPSITLTQQRSLTQGWNILSLFVTPKDVDMKNIMSSLISSGSLVKVQDEAGNAIEQLPVVGWVNNIGNWSPTQGYCLKVKALTTLSIQGQSIALPIQIPLSAGWNIISYPTQTPSGALNVMQQLINSNYLVKMQSEDGRAIEDIPGAGWFDNIGTLQPGEGYYVKVNSGCSLSIGGSTNSIASASEKSQVKVASAKKHVLLSGRDDEDVSQSRTVTATNHFLPVWNGNPYLAMNIYVTYVDIGGTALEPGDEIGVFDGDVCVGANTVSSGIDSTSPFPLVASEDDPGTAQKDGFAEGDAISYKVWKSASAQEITGLHPNYVVGNGVFIPQGTAVVRLSTGVKGDVSGNGDITAFDAALILMYVVGDTNLGPYQLLNADVSGNGAVTAYDASLILRYVVGDTSIHFALATKREMPDAVSSLASSGGISLGDGAFDASDIARLSIKLDDAHYVNAIQITLNVGQDVGVQDVNGTLPKDWQLFHHLEKGVLKIAMAGATPLSSGKIATVQFNLKDKFAKADVTGSAVINENPPQALSSIELRSIPTKFALDQNYPNPFNPTTMISYQLPAVSFVTLKVFDVLGREVRTLASEVKKPGRYELRFDAGDLPSGVYFYRMEASGFLDTKKLVLIR